LAVGLDLALELRQRVVDPAKEDHLQEVLDQASFGLQT